ncbi:putative NAD(P)/FAD-binding protein YdhS [Shinella sp. BE166]|uniref:dATP/dGTP pyrophosphohydrolase domain-containing protein n=1 Tax=Shinella sp. BE166 TaxID=3373918 RepID=UPI003EBC85C2
MTPHEPTLTTYFARHIEWSRKTFGAEARTKGLTNHIRKELLEIEREPRDLSEWVDVIILAMDGFWLHGGKAEDLMPALMSKQEKNMARTWADPRTLSEGDPIEHDRSGDPPTTSEPKRP